MYVSLKSQKGDEKGLLQFHFFLLLSASLFLKLHHAIIQLLAFQT